MDGEFENLRGELAEMGVMFNVASHDQHVGEVGWYICTIKERMGAINSVLPFKNIPTRLTIEMAKLSMFWLNSFCTNGVVSEGLSPWTIITGQKLDYN